ncbi:MAG: VWA domain-containing protein [Treponema sp.]|nr:VWA domain-containing protein [Treponema sp.]
MDVASTETEQKGPVIICVDTSGSMSGAPERVAKTITFALAKKCLEGERGCYLISFSTGIEVQDLSVFDAAGGLAALIRFLRNSFNRGTEVSPALKHSLELMQEKEWKNADVLVVSDMIMGTLTDDVVRQMKEQQKKKTKFYSLVIGSSGNRDVMNFFDEVWSYDTNARDAMRHLVRQINSIGERGEKDI